MLASILPVRSLLVAILVLMAGTGFLMTFLSLRLESAGIRAPLIGLITTAYFAGLTLGSLCVFAVIRRVGHIRAFAAFVSIVSASMLAYAVYQDAVLWIGLRFIDGLCLAGVFVCLESWLNERAGPETRGSVLAGYMVALYTGQAMGQFLINAGHAAPSLPFMAASILISLSVVPIALTRIKEPSLGLQSSFSMRSLYVASPLGIVGVGVTGLMLGAFYALGAVEARRLGMSLSETAAFMSTVIAGGVALQWPLGRLSDRFDRRQVIVGAFAGAVAASFALSSIGGPGEASFVLGGLFGGLAFALYPLCVAHTNDHLTVEQRVGASGGLVLVYSVGATIGPIAGATAMMLFGSGGLFLFIGCCSAGALAFALWRQRRREPVAGDLQQPYQALPRTTPMSAKLDPLAPDA